MNIEEEKDYIIGLINNGQYSYAKEKLSELIREIEKRKTVFNRSNTCNSCDKLIDNNCTADEDFRKHNMINPNMSCDVIFELLKSVDNIKLNEEKSEICRRISTITLEDLFRPFTI